MTDPIKAKIQELVPIERLECECGHIMHNPDKSLFLPVTLAVVLRAIQTSGDWYFSGVADNQLVFEQRSQYFYWDLTKNFDDQTLECKAFIGSLLNA